MKKYGTRAAIVAGLCTEDNQRTEKLHPQYPYIKAEVLYAIRFEIAITPRDIIARRFRLELLDWKTSYEITSLVCEIMATEFNWVERIKENAILNYQTFLSKFNFIYYCHHN